MFEIAIKALQENLEQETSCLKELGLACERAAKRLLNEQESVANQKAHVEQIEREIADLKRLAEPGEVAARTPVQVDVDVYGRPITDKYGLEAVPPENGPAETLVFNRRGEPSASDP